MQQLQLNTAYQVAAPPSAPLVGVSSINISGNIVIVTFFYGTDNGSGGVTPTPSIAPVTVQFDANANTYALNEVSTVALSDQAVADLASLIQDAMNDALALLGDSITPGTIPAIPAQPPVG